MPAAEKSGKQSTITEGVGPPPSPSSIRMFQPLKLSTFVRRRRSCSLIHGIHECSSRRDEVCASHICHFMTSFQVLLLAFVFIGCLPLCKADRLMAYLCSPQRNYTANSTFQSNLVSLVASLAASAPATNFANETAGKIPDRVYGMAICRGDIDPATCRSCLDIAAQYIVPACSGNKGAIVYYDRCHLRYSDENFFSTFGAVGWTVCSSYNASDPPTFNRLVIGLLNNLTARAVSSERRFAADSVDFTELQRLYALVQCTKDLSPLTCGECLGYYISLTRDMCLPRQGARINDGSCFLRYEVFSFFNATAAADPPPPKGIGPPPPKSIGPPPPNRSPPVTAKGKRQILLLNRFIFLGILPYVSL